MKFQGKSERGVLMDLIRIRDARKTYKNGVTAIQDLNLDIKKGELVLLLVMENIFPLFGVRLSVGS